MSSFGLNPVNESTDSLASDGFFPEIEIGDFQKVFHEVNGVDFEKIKFQLLLAMAYVNTRLESVKENTTVNTLAETNTNTVGGLSVTELHYQTAVFAHAKAELLPVAIDVVSREKASDLESNREQLTRDFRTTRNQAIRTLLGKNSATVELI